MQTFAGELQIETERRCLVAPSNVDWTQANRYRLQGMPGKGGKEN